MNDYEVDLRSWSKKHGDPYSEYPPRNDRLDDIDRRAGVNKDTRHMGDRVDYEQFIFGGSKKTMNFCAYCDTAYPRYIGAACPNCGRRQY